MEQTDRLDILKQYETNCYSICFFLLQCELSACEAAANALINLTKCDSFFQSDSETKSEMLRKESIRTALQIKKQIPQKN